MGRYLSQRYDRVILFSGYPVLTAVNSLQHRCAISGCRLAHKLESLRFYIGSLWCKDGRHVTAK